ncbi:MAG: amidohydrolase family protein [Thermomicrobiales bacterium]|nr:amidohydrolase family protein [Thermomicrobiales bacterium]
MKAIDAHGHFGPYDRGLGTRVDRFMSANAADVVQRGLDCGIEITVVSAIHGLIPYRGNPIRGNNDAAEAVSTNAALRFWTIIDPRVPETYDQSDRLLDHPACCGIKVHPHAHQFEIREHGPAIFAFAAERNAVVLTHSGDIGSYPEDFVPFADRYPNVKLILAHLGNSDDGSVSRQVEAIERARNGNLYVDTSSARSMFAGLIEWAVARIGFDRILFGTDTPLYWAGAQKGRIETAEIGEDAKRAILSENAASLLGLDRQTAE